MIPPRIRVLIAEDHPLFRSALVGLVAADSAFAPPLEAADGVEALELVRLRRPHVALFDIEMPRLDGLSLVRAVQHQRLDVQVCLLTAYKDPALFEEAMSLGVRGYVLKETAVADIIVAIKTVAAGSAFISPTLAGLLLERRHRMIDLRKERRGLERLSPAEQRILKMIAVDKTSKEIAEELGISSRTVENHRAHIAQKLDLHGAHSLVKFALGHRDAL